MQGNAAAPDILNAEVLKNEKAYSQTFSSARPFRHVVINNFLSEDFCTAVCDQFPLYDEKRALNEDGYIGGKATQEAVEMISLLQSRIIELESSTSWRLTAPLRAVKRLLTGKS